MRLKCCFASTGIIVVVLISGYEERKTVHYVDAEWSTVNDVGFIYRKYLLFLYVDRTRSDG